MPELQPEIFFDFNHLLDGDPGLPSALYFFYGLFFLMVFAFGAYVYRGILPKVTHKLRRHYNERLAVVDMVLGGVGLLLVIFRVASIPLLSARILIYAWLVITALYVFFVAYFLNAILPRRLREYEVASARLQYQSYSKYGKGSPAKKKRKK